MGDESLGGFWDRNNLEEFWGLGSLEAGGLGSGWLKKSHLP